MYTVKSALLERALDVVVRDLRLTTGTPPTHSGLKTQICAETKVVPDCVNNLAIELYNIDPRAWYDLPEGVICTNRSEEVDPVTTFHNGMDNDLMIIQVCVKYTPIFDNFGLSAFLEHDTAGDTAIVARSAFVQEPT